MLSSPNNKWTSAIKLKYCWKLRLNFILLFILNSLFLYLMCLLVHLNIIIQNLQFQTLDVHHGKRIWNLILLLCLFTQDKIESFSTYAHIATVKRHCLKYVSTPFLFITNSLHYFRWWRWSIWEWRIWWSWIRGWHIWWCPEWRRFWRLRPLIRTSVNYCKINNIKDTRSFPSPSSPIYTWSKERNIRKS